MKKLIAALAVATAFATPTLAQELETYTEEQVAQAYSAIEDAQLTDTLHQNFWCGAAFIILNQLLASRGMADDAAQAQGYADVVVGNAAVEAVSLGVSEADFNAMAQNFRIVAIAQTGEGAEADYTQEDCVAAATQQ